MALSDSEPKLVPKKKKQFHEFTMQGGPIGKDLEIFMDGKLLMGVTNVMISAAYDDVVRVELSLIGVLGFSHVEATFKEIEASTLEHEGTLLFKKTVPSHLTQIAADLKSIASVSTGPVEGKGGNHEPSPPE